jgi:hypothetical protein
MPGQRYKKKMKLFSFDIYCMKPEQPAAIHHLIEKIANWYGYRQSVNVVFGSQH